MTTETRQFELDTEGVDAAIVEQLRDYQLESTNNILHAWKHGCRSVMYQSPTGSGKTPTIAAIVKMCHDKGYKTLTIAHREELVDNIGREYFDMFGIETSAIKAGLKRDYSVNHQVASIATYVNALDFNPDLIITDEGHHCLAPTYLTIYAAHPQAKLLMATATPYRLSGLGFRDICDELVLGLSVLQLEKMGNIMPAKLYAMRTYTREQIAQVSVVKGEYSESQMSDLLSETDQIMSVVDTYLERGEGKQMMLYATNVAHSKKLLDAFTYRGVAAGHVDGKTKNRKEIFEQFIKKEIQVLSNCEIATEGNNIPGIEIIGLARKTKSLSLYLQMVGRGSRPADGKTEYLLFDFVDNYWDHGLPNREHDWKSHFMGVEKADRKRKAETEEIQFQVKSEVGEVFISTLPNGFKGQILHEVDPLNTRHAEILRKQAERLAELERKKAEKQAELERKIAAREAEIIRRREAKEAEIQRKKEEKLAEIQRKKEAKEAAIRKKEEAARMRILAREAAKQKKIDDRIAEIQRKKEEIAAEIKRKEENALNRIAAREAAKQKKIDDAAAEVKRREDEIVADIKRKEDARQRKIDAQQAAKQKKIDDAAAEIQRQKDALQRYEEAKLAAIQKKKDEKEAKIRKEEAAKQAEINRREEIRLAHNRQRDEWYNRINRNSLINDIQYQQRSKRASENAKRSKAQSDAYYKRWDVIRETSRKTTDLTHEEYMVHSADMSRLFEENRYQTKYEKDENTKILKFQRIEVQFEKTISRTHDLSTALVRICRFCDEKSYSKPTYELMEHIVEPYLENDKLFTRNQFEKVMETLGLYGEVGKKNV
jgi:superfamily II DNA or RNA helicase